MRRPVLFLAVVAMVAAFLVQTQPAYASPPAGALLNPSVDTSGNGPGTVISDKADGTDSRYHFTVRANPTTAGTTVSSVRIQIQPPTGVTFITIGNATRVGTTDTWELLWNMTNSGIPPGFGFVRALIQDSNKETAFVPSETGLKTNFDNSQATAEMTTPVNGGSVGFGSGAGASTTLSGTASGDTSQISAFYTKSDGSSAQTWTSCGSGPVTPNPAGTTTFSVTCALAGSDTAAQVMAVAVEPISNAPIPQTPGAGDAHRVSTFSQAPNSVTISGPLSQSTSHCAFFTVQVINGTGNNVANATVDVHAKGPASNVYFASDGTKTDSFTSPISPSAGHSSYESAATCDATTNAGTPGGIPSGPGMSSAEGVHTGSTPNTKHIDGSTGPTGFHFAVVSFSAGATSIQAWNDLNANDVNDNPGEACPASGGTSEPCAVASVTFEAAVASSVALTPAQSSSAAGKTAKVTATVIDQHQNPMSGAGVSFSVTHGPNASQNLDGDASTPPGYFGFCVTGNAGTCPKSYTDMAKQAGTDTVTGFVDQNGDQAPETGEPQSTVTQTWTTKLTTTSLTISPTKRQTIHKGQAVTFHGQLSSADRPCVAGQVVKLFNGKGVVAREKIPANEVHQSSGGNWGGGYSFTRKAQTTQTYHVEFQGTAACAASRAPKSGGVKVSVK